MARNIPRPQEIYRHFKGNDKLYQIITIAEHSETKEKMVVYQALYGNFGVYVRPLSMFMSKVDKEKYPDAKAEYRFEKVETETTEALVDVKEETKSPDIELKQEEEKVNPDLLEFLNSDTYEEKKNILKAMRPRLTDRLIDDIAAYMDVVVEDGDIDMRYESLLSCVMTKCRYEINRS